MLGSVALPQFSNAEMETTELDEWHESFLTSGRSAPSTILASGSGQANEDGEHLSLIHI